eukprot:Tbor_TRINITY_DN5540_c0_g1::TRINITY_DN5540_c0_g1_i1::g.12566::m.12566/K13979/yahK; uncharacterized zinc-type alcohol dehydrogenase-like protein
MPPIETKAMAVHNEKDIFHEWKLTRRELGKDDIHVSIIYAGICHSDIHTARGEWGPARYPLVPGHEILGRVMAVGEGVTDFKVGDLAGVGCYVNSCRACPCCKTNEEQYCKECVMTYNSCERDGKTPTYGGYSTDIVVDKKYTLHISEKLDSKGVAPLMCAGITTYSPMKRCGITKGHKVGVLGLGGLGHMAVKFGVAFGAEVTVISTSIGKKEDAKKLGATNFLVSTDKDAMGKVAGTLDFIVNTVSAQHDYNMYLNLLGVGGTMIVVGVPPQPVPLAASGIIFGRKCIVGSLIGGMKETQEMLDFCAEKNITSDVEIIAANEIDTAYERMIKSDVKYRFVIDIDTLRK